MPPSLLEPAPGRAPGFDLVVVAASAGGVRALREVLSALPADFCAPVVVVQHRTATGPSYLRAILAQHCALEVRDAADGDRVAAGAIYLAPQDRHVTVEADGTLALGDGDRVHFSRPAADPLFRSAAAGYRNRALAVVLTGRGVDGAAGAREVRRNGGAVLVQDPATCEASSMPLAVLGNAGADFVLPLDKIADALRTLVMSPGLSSVLFGLPRAVA